MTTGDLRLAEEMRRFSWYHTIELAPGVVTEGMFDHRPVRDRFLLPQDLSGMRCLDVGTMDGFWAFEMERRGAREVVATDVGNPDELDWPPRWRPRVQTTLDDTKAARFELARSALDSRVQRIECSVYELGPSLGTFDLIFCGDLLVHLTDPIRAVARMHSICRGSVILCNPVKRFRFARGALAEIDGIDEFRWWLLSEASMRRMMVAVGFDQVQVGKRFDLPARGGGKWKGTRAVMRGFTG